MSDKKDPFVGYVPNGPEWKAYMMKQTKALCIEVASGIADDRDRLRGSNKALMLLLNMVAIGVARFEKSDNLIEFCFQGLRYACSSMNWLALVEVVGVENCLASLNASPDAPKQRYRPSPSVREADRRSDEETGYFEER